jgi:hypothetical protein
MLISERDLTRILSQPGYSADGPLAAPATQARPGIAQAPIMPSDSLMGAESLTGRPERPTSLWRNEHEFQSAVFAEAAIRAILQPEYAMLMAIPNGQYRKGQRAEAGIMPGAPDILLAVQRGGHGALFIELKVRDGKPSEHQREVLHRLRMEGYRCMVIWDSVEDVMREIEGYLCL